MLYRRGQTSALYQIIYIYIYKFIKRLQLLKHDILCLRLGHVCCYFKVDDRLFFSPRH